MEGKQVQLFATCLVDALAPQVGKATLAALEGAGCDVAYPSGQSCCGQPAFNVGMHEEARQMAASTLDVLDETEGPIVVPSGSCASMMRHHYSEVFKGTDREEQAQRVAGRVRELTEFLVEDLEESPSAGCDGCQVAFHYSCHGLRELGLAGHADTLLEASDRVELADDKVCCGFGGVFSVEMPSVSDAILQEKLDRIEESGADVVVGGDFSCLMHIEGGLRRRDSDIEVKHIAELLGGQS